MQLQLGTTVAFCEACAAVGCQQLHGIASSAFCFSVFGASLVISCVVQDRSAAAMCTAVVGLTLYLLAHHAVSDSAGHPCGQIVGACD
jgi:hypothetical protein